jgi:hypothetical protein
LRARRLVPFLVGLAVAGLARGSTGRAQEIPPAADGTAPSSAALAALPPLERHRRVLALLSAGVQSIQNEGSPTGPGLRLGLLLGGRLDNRFSINAELVYDVLNPDRAVPGVTFYDFEAVAAPLLHLSLPRGMQALAGPKLGLFRAGASGQGERDASDAVYTGLLVGANLGAFVRISRRNEIDVGGLVGLDLEKAFSCSVNGNVGNGVSCAAAELPVQELVSVSAGVLF